jgi:hypothetical protein
MACFALPRSSHLAERFAAGCALECVALTLSDIVAGLDPAAHRAKKMEPRVKPGGDEQRWISFAGKCFWPMPVAP